MTRARAAGRGNSGQNKVIMRRMAMAPVVAAAGWACSLTVWAQGQPTPRPHFSLAFRATSADIFLICDEGCAWKADNVMVPGPVERYSRGTRPFAPFGGVESAKLTSMGTIYAGYYSSTDVCYYTDSDFSESRNTCRFQTAIEITLLTETRIEGQAESGFAFDCRSCRITGKPRMKPFVWTPVK